MTVRATTRRGSFAGRAVGIAPDSTGGGDVDARDIAGACAFSFSVDVWYRRAWRSFRPASGACSMSASTASAAPYPSAIERRASFRVREDDPRGCPNFMRSRISTCGAPSRQAERQSGVRRPGLAEHRGTLVSPLQTDGNQCPPVPPLVRLNINRQRAQRAPTWSRPFFTSTRSELLADGESPRALWLDASAS